ncbi:bifunctional adenosylcobinamide kinase/adenosylcobinamide-phosphate guanylyltransferase [Metabacillus herbersteinensis]|uniref:Adenosylcobinamide kinase n=2 Tax=Metabacillus herbersteinensis TaxID=283816 RepID=A0ABV6GD06_9BACI
MILFISGGVRSGKSHFAEQMAITLAGSSKQLHYVATSHLYDDEMKRRIQKHKHDRNSSKYLWKTWEFQRDLSQLVKYISKQDVVLVDCLTTLVANELFDSEIAFQQQSVHDTVFSSIQELAQASHDLLLVSNEIFSSVNPYDDSTIHYMKELGKLHIKTVELADCAYVVENGIPLCKKSASALFSPDQHKAILNRRRSLPSI